MPVGTEVDHKINKAKARNGLEAVNGLPSKLPPQLILCNSVPVLSGSKRIVILTAYSMIIDLVYQLFEVVFFACQVDFIGIDNQKGGFGVIKEEVIEGPVDVLQILILHVLFESPASFFHPAMQNRGLGLQKYDQIRLGDLDFDQVEQLFVEVQFVALQVQSCENPVTVKQVVGNHHIAEQIPLGKLQILVVPVQQKKNLGLEGVGGPVFIKLVHEGVVLVHFKDKTGIVLLGQPVGQSGFPGPDGSFDGNESRFVHGYFQRMNEPGFPFGEIRWVYRVLVFSC